MENTKKILVITYYWPPSGGPGVQRWLKFVKYLPEFGIRPVVLTVDPACAEYPIIDTSLGADVPSGTEVYRTEYSGVYHWYTKITGSKSAPYGGFANESHPGMLQQFARFVRGNFFLPDARRGWIGYAFAEACRLIEKYGIDTVVTTGPPHSTHLTGLKLKKKYGVRWIVDFRDPWSDVYYNDALFQTRWAQKINQRYEQSVLDHCDFLLLCADQWKTLVVAPRKLVFLPNGFDPADFDGKTASPPDIFTICYTGTIADSYPTAALLEALVALRQKTVFRLRFVGKATDSIRERFTGCLGNLVEFTDYVPHSAAISYMMSSSVLLLVIPRAGTSRSIVTGKIFEYLASGKPVLMIGPPDGTIAGIIAEAKAGASFEDDDVRGIKNFLLQQYQFHSDGTHPAPDRDYIQRFSRRAITQQLAETIG